MMLRAMMAGTAALLFRFCAWTGCRLAQILCSWKAWSKVQGGNFTASTRMLDRTWLQMHSRPMLL